MRRSRFTGATSRASFRICFAHYRVKLVAFPSTGPESFSLTLSEAWSAGLPAIVPPIGALAERMRASGAGWVWTDAEWRSDDAMLARIAELVDAAKSDALAAAGSARAGGRSADGRRR